MPDARREPKNDTDRQYLLLGLRIVGEFGAAIAAPVVVLAVIGKRLDERFGTRPWLLIAGFAVAAAISAVIVVRRAKEFGKMYDAIDKGPAKGPRP